MSVSIVDVFKNKKNDADGNYDSVSTEYANLDIEWVKKVGNQTISADTSWGNATNDARNLFILVKGNLTIDSGKTLTAAARKRGMFIYVNGNCTINGTISMSARGASANGQRLLLCNIDSDYEVSATGAAGGAAKTSYSHGANGSNGSTTQTGGGGSGGCIFINSGSGSSGAGGVGTSYSGGSGGGGISRESGTGYGTDGSSSGGAGGNGNIDGTTWSKFGGGGAGNPIGVNASRETTSIDPVAGTGGLLVIYVTGILSIGDNGKLEAKGSKGGSSTGGDRSAGGGGSGGGHIDVFYKSLSGLLVYNVSGGEAGTSVGAVYDNYNGGAGGAGSSRATQVALPNLFAGGAFLLNMV